MNPVLLFPEITAALAATFSGAPHSMAANRQVPRVTVTGEGEKAIPPDMAVSPLSVLGEEKTARAVLDANFEAMADAMVKATAFIEAAGVEPEEAPTIVERSFRPRPMPVACAETAMRASNTVFITSRENIHRMRDIRHRTIIPTCRNGFTPSGRSSGAQMAVLPLPDQ